jgi:hypothetical protein
MDRCDPKTDLKEGDKVTVKNLPGCPKANTMGHCYVFVGTQFKGMVCCNSLHTEKDYKEYLKTKELEAV